MKRLKNSKMFEIQIMMHLNVNLVLEEKYLLQKKGHEIKLPNLITEGAVLVTKCFRIKLCNMQI